MLTFNSLKIRHLSFASIQTVNGGFSGYVTVHYVKETGCNDDRMASRPIRARKHKCFSNINVLLSFIMGTEFIRILYLILGALCIYDIKQVLINIKQKQEVALAMHRITVKYIIIQHLI